MTIADINLEIRSLCDADSTSLTDAVLLRRVNQAYEEVVGKLIQLDGSWNFDDTNFTTFPIGTQTLVANQQDYAFDTTFLNILRIQVMDNAGDWHLLTPIDKANIDVALEEYKSTSGLPDEYDKEGKSIVLYPAPAAANVTLAAGLKVHFQRTADLYTSAQVTTGTKEPGFASPYHYLLVYRAAIPYCLSYKKDRVPLFEERAAKLERELLAFYARREKDVRKVMSMGSISHR